VQVVSMHYIFGTVQDQMKQISPKSFSSCSFIVPKNAVADSSAGDFWGYS